MAAAYMGEGGNPNHRHIGFSPHLQNISQALKSEASCVRVLPRQVGVDPNGKDQTSQPCADVVIGHTGSACCKKAIIKKGNPGMETPLMLAARGASEGAMRVRA